VSCDVFISYTSQNDEFGRVSTFRTISKSATFQAITDRFAGYQAEWLNGRRHAPAGQRRVRGALTRRLEEPSFTLQSNNSSVRVP
jgi:hypothetical protein